MMNTKPGIQTFREHTVRGITVSWLNLANDDIILIELLWLRDWFVGADVVAVDSGYNDQPELRYLIGVPSRRANLTISRKHHMKEALLDVPTNETDAACGGG